MRLRLGIAAVALCALASSTALAQPSEQDKALALTLFKRGRELMEAKDLARACESFAESQRLDPGGGTLLNLAVCHEEQGRTATAWAEFSDALALARRDQRADRVELALSRMAALEPALSRLVITPPAPAEGASRDLRVLRDGAEVPPAAFSLPIPVDPGHHVVEAYALGALVFHAEVDVAPHGDVQNVTVTPSAVPPLDSAAPAVPSSPPPEHQGSDARTLAGWSFVAAGVVSVGVGTFFGVRALGKKSDSDDGCPAGRCTTAAVEDNESAMTLADVSTITIAAGLAIAAAGVVLLVSRPSHSRASSRATWRGLAVAF